MGFTPLEASKKSSGMKLEINLRPGKVKMKELAVFSRQFATMVNSGLPILRALAILAEQTDSKELTKVLTGVRMDVEQGASLSEAMEKHPKAFNDLYIAMVKSGETGGVLDDVLLRLADEIEKEVHLRQKIKSAMTYPIAVVVLVFAHHDARCCCSSCRSSRASTRSSAARCRCPRRVLLGDVEHLQDSTGGSA